MGEGVIAVSGMLILVISGIGFGWLMGSQNAQNFYKPLLDELHEIMGKRPGWLLKQRDVDFLREVATEHADLIHIEDLLELSDRMTKMIPPERP